MKFSVKFKIILALLLLTEVILAACMVLTSHPKRAFLLMTIVACILILLLPGSNYESISIGNDECHFGCTLKNLFIVIGSAIVVITLCSKSSPLYPLNDGADANIYMTLGRGLLAGKVPYRDLYDHKGFLVFVIYALASLVSRTSFLGVWIVEMVAAFFFLYWSLRSLIMLVGQRAYAYVPVLAVIVYSSTAFCHGGSAEEFCLPLLAYGFFVGLKSVVLKKLPNTKECLAIGLTSGCILWIKYNLLGFYLGWFIALMLLLPKAKTLKVYVKMVGGILIGVAMVTFPCLIYFAANNALTDLFSVYLNDNLGYAASGRFDNAVFGVVYNICRGFQEIWRNHVVAGVLILLGISFFVKIKRHQIAGYFVVTFVFCEIFCYMGGKVYQYYALPFSVFALAGITAIDCILFGKLSISDLKMPIMVIEMIFGALASFLLSPNTYMLELKKMDLPQYQFRDIIAQTPNASLLEYKTMDIGLYTVCDIVPEYKYFCIDNMEKTELYDAQETYLEEGQADFVVVMLRDTVSEGNLEIMSEVEMAGYGCVASSGYYNGENSHTYLLYKLKSISD